MEGTALAVPAAQGLSDLTTSPQYQELLEDCREICNSARVAVLEHMWRLGERIARDLPEGRSREDTYGKQIILGLERDLAVDRTTLIRAVQTYQRFGLPEIGDGSSPILTWGKLRMLLPLEDALFQQIWKRILSGELRTDDDVHKAIQALKLDLGMLPANASANPRYQLELDIDFNTDTPFRVSWGKAEPLTRAALVADLVPRMGIEQAPRPEALRMMAALRKNLDQLDRKLNRGGA